jgi:hypothetical protein
MDRYRVKFNDGYYTTKREGSNFYASAGWEAATIMSEAAAHNVKRHLEQDGFQNVELERIVVDVPAGPAAAFLIRKRELIEQVQVKLQAKAILLATLELYQDVEELGIDPDTVASFRFNPDKLHRCTLRRMRMGPNSQHRNIPSVSNPFFAPTGESGHGRPRWYNVVILKDGTEVVLQDALLAPEDRVEKHWSKELGKTPKPTTPVTGAL